MDPETDKLMAEEVRDVLKALRADKQALQQQLAAAQLAAAQVPVKATNRVVWVLVVLAVVVFVVLALGSGGHSMSGY